jgi:hypothetical protein
MVSSGDGMDGRPGHSFLPLKKIGDFTTEGVENPTEKT